MKRGLLAFVALSFLTLHGCASISEAGYYWGNYAVTLYAYQKSPSPETLAQHEKELRDIIEYSDTKQLKVPPGIYAELGYIEQNRGDSATALRFYQEEMATYPESQAFLERLSTGLSADPEEKD
jgi:hypothetical protein